MFDGEPAKRTSVFDQRASAVYLPPGSSIAVDVTAATRSSRSSRRSATTLTSTGRDRRHAVVQPDDVVVQARGKPGWQRDVHDVIADAVPVAPPARRRDVQRAGPVVVVPAAQARRRRRRTRARRGVLLPLRPARRLRFPGPVRGRRRGRGGVPAARQHRRHPARLPPRVRGARATASTTCGRSSASRAQLAMHEDPVHRWLNDR